MDAHQIILARLRQSMIAMMIQSIARGQGISEYPNSFVFSMKTRILFGLNLWS